jgi:hypothetical protein
MLLPENRKKQRERMQKYTDEELLEMLVERARFLGRTPNCHKECPCDQSTYANRFGSYNNAVLLAGLVPNVPLPKDFLKEDRPAVPLSLRFIVLARDGFRCQYCGGTPQDGYVLHVDHRVPRSKGGETKASNLVTACLLCNAGKADKTTAG